jgi:hypothetical protein
MPVVGCPQDAQAGRIALRYCSSGIDALVLPRSNATTAAAMSVRGTRPQTRWEAVDVPRGTSPTAISGGA